MEDLKFDKALAVKLLSGVDFKALEQWAEYRLRMDRNQLDQDKSEYDTAKLRGSIAAMGRVLRLRGDCEKITQEP